VVDNLDIHCPKGCVEQVVRGDNSTLAWTPFS
jgi:hypothetical protein